jgi:hypothetical protein
VGQAMGRLQAAGIVGSQPMAEHLRARKK